MRTAASSVLFLALAGAASASPVGIDGVIGGDWGGAGVTTHTATYNPLAPIGNFAAPTSENASVAYNTYFRTDGSYVYFAVQADPANGVDPINGFSTFSNIYIAVAPGGSTIGMEVTNDRFFIPGVPGYFANPAAPAYHADWAMNASTGVVEVAIPVAFFTDDPLGLGAAFGGMVRWRISQSLGYSAVGGNSYGDDRLGTVFIPAPTAAGLLGAGMLALSRRRR